MDCDIIRVKTKNHLADEGGRRFFVLVFCKTPNVLASITYKYTPYKLLCQDVVGDLSTGTKYLARYLYNWYTTGGKDLFLNIWLLNTGGKNSLDTSMGRNKKSLVLDPGVIYGNFLLLRTELRGKNKVYVTKCVCGDEKIFWKASAISKQKTCGCGKDEFGHTGKQRRSMKSRFNSYKQGAKKRNLNFNIPYSFFVKLVQGNCFYCGADPKPWGCIENAASLQKDSPNVKPEDYVIRFNGVDRINPSKGYSEENCVTCCVYCNRAKSDLSVSEFKEQVKKMYIWLFQNE